MKNFRKRTIGQTHLFILIVLYFISLDSFSQNISDQKVLYKPNKFNLPKSSIKIDYNDQDEMLGSFWTVYSDRSDNTTYSEPGGVNELTKLDFLEPCYVIDATSSYLHIIRDPLLDEKGLTSYKAEDLGWISMDRLILWEHCLVTDKGNVDKKAMVLNTLKSEKDDFDLAEKDISIIRFTSDPNLKKRNGRESNLFQLFYIYKMTDKAALLGTDAIFTNPSELQNYMWGWAPLDMLVFWDHRVALEPNWEEDAVNERKSNGISTKFFADQSNAISYKSGKSDIESFWSEDPYNKRNIGDWRRFPLLDINNGIVKSGVMGAVHGSNQGSRSPEEVAKLLRKFREMVKNKRKVNIVFVVDATSSMQEYFPPIKNAIIESVKELEDLYYNKNELKFGLVAYRDYAEGISRLVEYEDLTTSSERIINKIDDIKAGDIADKDTPEAVYYALNFALEQLLPDNESNVIILVGDAGNHINDQKVDAEEIALQLSRKNCSFLTFQVHHESHPSYDHFIDQMKNLMTSAADLSYSNYEATARKINIELAAPEFQKRDNNTYQLNNTAFIGSVVECPKNEAVPPLKLQNEVKETIVAQNLYVDNLLNIMKEMIEAGLDENIASQRGSDSIYANNYDHTVIDLLTREGYTQDEIEFMRAKNYQLYINGYSPMKIDGLSYPLYKRVLLLNNLELADLVLSIQKLISSSGNSTDLRERMKEAWKNLLKRYIGDFSEEEFNQMPMSEIHEKIFGVPIGDESLLKNMRLQDITNRSKLSEEDFAMYYAQIKSKYRELLKIINSEKYLYSFRSNEQPYYWISEDLLP